MPTVRPSAGWYLATGGIAVVGAIVAVVLLAGGIRDARGTGREATRVPLGQAGPVTFEHSQSFTLSYLGPSQVISRIDVPALAERIGATLQPAGGGPLIALAPYEGDSGIQTRPSGPQQVALSTFHIDRPGTYTLRSSLIQGVGANDADLVVSVSPFRALARGAEQGGIAFGISLVLSLIATVALAKTRGRARRTSTGRSVGGPGPAGGPWSGGPTPSPAPLGGGGPALPPGWYGPPPLVPPPPPGYGPGARDR